MNDILQPQPLHVEDDGAILAGHLTFGEAVAEDHLLLYLLSRRIASVDAKRIP